MSAGFTEQDDLLAVGVVPIAVTTWWGDEPFEVWPWAQPKLGSAQPEVLSIYDGGFQFDRIAALQPDLIVAINAGVDQDSYNRLSAIAPTIPQSGDAPFFEPWKTQATTIGQATFQPDMMRSLITQADNRINSVANTNPRFRGKNALLLQGTLFQDQVAATLPGWRTDFLTQMGFRIPDSINAFTIDEHRAFIPRDQIVPVLNTADVLIWTTQSEADEAGLRADPAIQQLNATAQNRNVFTGKELAGAIAFSIATEPACRGEPAATDAQCGSESLDGTVMPNAHAFCVAPLAIGVAILAAPAASADRPEPVPLFGSYDTFLDHSRQTFNGQPDFSDPSVQAATFTTTCVASGCVAHWLRLTELTENPNAPALFDYQWVNDRWESAGEYPFHCDDGSAITTTRSDSLTPNGDGSFAGERTFTVIGPGCPGDGAGTYWLPFTLTPT